jgi:hypothetical protein
LCLLTELLAKSQPVEKVAAEPIDGPSQIQNAQKRGS